MEKQKGTNIIALIALVVGVVSLSLGFAAFSKTLDITSNATVTPDKTTFNVDFSSVANSDVTTGMTINATEGAGGSGTLSNESDTTSSLSDLVANFTNIGQTVTYTFYARNVGEYDAWLKSINFAKVDGKDSFITCSAGEGTNATMVENACKTIKLTVKVGTDAAVSDTVTFPTSTHELKVDASEPIVVTVSYNGDANVLNSARADGQFTVKFGKISLTYSSVQ